MPSSIPPLTAMLEHQTRSRSTRLSQAADYTCLRHLDPMTPSQNHPNVYTTTLNSDEPNSFPQRNVSSFECLVRASSRRTQHRCKHFAQLALSDSTSRLRSSMRSPLLSWSAYGQGEPGSECLSLTYSRLACLVAISVHHAATCFLSSWVITLRYASAFGASGQTLGIRRLS